MGLVPAMSIVISGLTEEKRPFGKFYWGLTVTHQFWQCYGGPYNSITMSGTRMAGAEGQDTGVKILTGIAGVCFEPCNPSKWEADI